MIKKTKPGKVYIIGAGPGDAGLITLKAVEALCAADVVIYDTIQSLLGRETINSTKILYYCL